MVIINAIQLVEFLFSHNKIPEPGAVAYCDYDEQQPLQAGSIYNNAIVAIGIFTCNSGKAMV